MLLAACGKFNGSDREPSLTRNLCYRCRNTGSLRGAMKNDPIGSVRLAALLVGALLLGGALAQPPGYPARTIRLVAGTAPGGITDYLARMSAEGLAIQLGAQVVVENKAGGARPPPPHPHHQERHAHTPPPPTPPHTPLHLRLY